VLSSALIRVYTPLGVKVYFTLFGGFCLALDLPMFLKSGKCSVGQSTSGKVLICMSLHVLRVLIVFLKEAEELTACVASPLRLDSLQEPGLRDWEPQASYYILIFPLFCFLDN